MLGTLRGVFARFLPRRVTAPETSDEELPPEYAHLPIYNAAELRNTAVRSGAGKQVTYHDKEQKNGVLESAPKRKRKRADSPNFFEFLTQRRKKHDKRRPSIPNVQDRPLLKRMRTHFSESSSESSPHRPTILTSLLAKRKARDSASYKSEGSNSDSSSSHVGRHGAKLPLPARSSSARRVPSQRNRVTANQEWEEIDDMPASRLSQPQRWNPWPDGTWETTYSREYFEQCQFAVHWACEVRGGKRNSVGSSRAKDKYDGAHTHRHCLGVMKCTNRHCEIITRPQTKNAGRKAQLQTGCSCGSTLRHYPCDVQIKYWVYRDGAHFQHSGYHHHEKVPVRHLTLRERVQFETVVNEHPRMGPAQLLAGRPAVDGPGPSVADISTVFLNPHRIQYERRKILNPENKIRDQRFFPKLERFKEKHPDWTIGLHWEGNINVIVLQSPWQRRIGLKDKIKSEAVNGIVSDACHDYFAGHNQLLFLSSTFEPAHLKSWVPILMTYSNGASAVHYRIHFLYLFRGLAQQCGKIKRKVTDELFANASIPKSSSVTC
ncbi:hypothetical protein B0H13DRAFT_2382597 [Mycena leptocephala]|nr:hypothetical protein B0H13DRAFT_2382597 [Mycena leptocephala]